MIRLLDIDDKNFIFLGELDVALDTDLGWLHYTYTVWGR